MQKYEIILKYRTFSTCFVLFLPYKHFILIYLCVKIATTKTTKGMKSVKEKFGRLLATVLLLMGSVVMYGQQTVVDLGYNWNPDSEPNLEKAATTHTWSAGTTSYTVYKNTDAAVLYSLASGGTVKAASAKDVYANPASESFSYAQLDDGYNGAYLEGSVQGESTISVIRLNGTSASTSAGVTVGVLYSDRSPFDPDRVVGYVRAELPACRAGEGMMAFDDMPVGTRSFRIYNPARLSQVSEGLWRVDDSGDIVVGAKDDGNARIAYICTLLPMTAPTYTVTVVFKDAEGNTLKDDVVYNGLAIGTAFSVPASLLLPFQSGGKFYSLSTTDSQTSIPLVDDNYTLTLRFAEKEASTTVDIGFDWDATNSQLIAATTGNVWLSGQTDYTFNKNTAAELVLGMTSTTTNFVVRSAEDADNKSVYANPASKAIGYVQLGKGDCITGSVKGRMSRLKVNGTTSNTSYGAALRLTFSTEETFDGSKIAKIGSADYEEKTFAKCRAGNDGFEWTTTIPENARSFQLLGRSSSYNIRLAYLAVEFPVSLDYFTATVRFQDQNGDEFATAQTFAGQTAGSDFTVPETLLATQRIGKFDYIFDAEATSSTTIAEISSDSEIVLKFRKIPLFDITVARQDKSGNTLAASLTFSNLREGEAFSIPSELTNTIEKDGHYYVIDLSTATGIVSITGNETITLQFDQQDNVGTTYYVDSENGNDENDGKSEATAWRTLDRVNQGAQGQGFGYQAGDQILLKAGQTFTGMLYAKGNGLSGKPIVISQYGEGDRPKIVRGGGFTTVDGMELSAAVLLYNQQYVEISHLDITNRTANWSDGAAWRQGILVLAKDAGKLSHLHVSGCYVHEVNAKGVTRIDGGGYNKSAGGIHYAIEGNTTDTWFDDVLIENNRIEDTAFGLGLSTFWTTTKNGKQVYNQNVVVRGNYVSTGLHDLGNSKDGIIVRVCKNALIEHNTCYKNTQGGIYPYYSRGTIIQYNETAYTKGLSDGYGLDDDQGNEGTIIQYNFSHHNDHGFALVMSSKSTWRYNISVNDSRYSEPNQIFIDAKASLKDVKFYNNTIYMDEDCTENTVSLNNSPLLFQNNIFYVKSKLRFKNADKATYTSNTFCGDQYTNLPAGTGQLTDNPLFINAGGDQPEDYLLQAASPAKGCGAAIPGYTGADYFGNSLGTTINQGAYEGNGIVLLSETDTEEPEAYDDVTVRLSRQFTQGWNSIVLPFDLTDAQVKSAFGDDAVVKTMTTMATTSESSVALNFEETTLEAGKPVMLKLSAPITEPIWIDNVSTSNAAVTPVVAMSDGTNYTFTGTYTAISDVPGEFYVVSDATLYHKAAETTDVSMRAYGAYIAVTGTTDSRRLVLNLEGEATGIKDINRFSTINRRGSVYDLQGRKMKGDVNKGVYIVHGRKIVK